MGVGERVGVEQCFKCGIIKCYIAECVPVPSAPLLNVYRYLVRMRGIYLIVHTTARRRELGLLEPYMWDSPHSRTTPRTVCFISY